MFENKYYDRWWKEMLFDQTHPKIVSHTEFVKATEAWFSFAGKQRKSSYRSLIIFLNTGKIYKDGKWHMTEEAYHVVQLCLSPHAHALLTTYWIKKYNGKKSKWPSSD